MINSLNIRVFRAIDDLDSSVKFSDGHRSVLEAYNLAYVATADTKWMENPDVYVIIAEDAETKEALAGARIHVAGANDKLPMVEAISKVDENIHKTISKYRSEGTAEFCALWNSVKVAGYGIGSQILARVGVARVGVTISDYLNLGSMFALCAKYTVRNALRLGFVPEKSIGDNGNLIYPNPEFPVSLLVLKDPKDLSSTIESERELILKLRMSKQLDVKEKGGRGVLNVHYDLNL